MQNQSFKASVPTAGQCRLCHGPLQPLFKSTLLRKYEVDYFKCTECHSLQTEPPYWLDEAYGKNLSSLDTGAAQRNIHNWAACSFISRLFAVKNVIDMGGGDGLLCRLLRDHGLNCYVKDRYASPNYAQGFTDPDFETPDLVLGFEVMEHFANPAEDLEDIFKYKSKFVLLSTELYAGQTKEWWYLTPDSGQHIFFYSQQAIELIANKHGYSFVVSGGFILFFRNNVSSIKRIFANILLKARICRLLKPLVVMLPCPGVGADYVRHTEKIKKVG
ncbi:class I SAM-dependent methyltransferase [Pseudomonas fuscovaginae UPB0736]|uniref:class I SAM-dependent methyltransferase n=1 Tax=Pseudomonas asplenii TaxID=53407 RepID=UPI0009B68007|nr:MULTISPECIES: class I SAM-dependent methyltransferase [Pseudomonas]UUQ66748.1 class I SAM-dependent methyltransferase [Pseudomonas fuscovaginae UPB0736]UZE29971.1 class I SAM-dependent methyltransferase [Pseudomonas asplenii]